MAAQVSLVKRRVNSLSSSWKKMKDDNDDDDLAVAIDKENDGGPDQDQQQRPATRSVSGSDVRNHRSAAMLVRATSQIGTNIQAKVATGMLTVRNAMGTIRRKLKQTTTRKRKRLVVGTPSPYTSRRSSPGSSSLRKKSTPDDLKRRSDRLARREVKMYSPFSFDSPAPLTPRSIRMGTSARSKQRFNFGSPAGFNNDMAVVDAGMQSLSQNDAVATPDRVRTGIRTTPRAQRTNGGKKKALFI